MPPLSPPEGEAVLVGGTIYASPADEPIVDGILSIRDGKVSAVGSRKSLPLPPGVPALDCSGLAITAGLWNNHVHFFERKWANAGAIPAAELERQLQDMLTSHGFTSVFDVGSMWENTRTLRDRIESGEVRGPRIRSTGEALVAPGAVPPEKILGVLGIMTFPAPEIHDAAQSSAASRRLLASGVDGIKVHLQIPPPPSPPFPESAIPAAVRAAHRLGKPVFVHPNTGADVLAAARSGVDVIGHTTPRSGPWDAIVLREMRERRIALTPTLSAWKSLTRHDRASAQEELVSTAVGQLRAFASSGGAVLFGTDVGAFDYDPGEEYLLMVEAGMSFAQILASLTTEPAQRFGESSRLGRIVEGFQADLVVLDGDPAENIRALARVRCTLRDGKVLYGTLFGGA